MDIRTELLAEHSKKQTLKITNYVGSDQKKYDHLIKLFLADEYRVTQRAAWVVSHCAEKYPFLINKHLEPIVKNLQGPIHVAVKRNTLKLLQDIDLPLNLQGIAATVCFDFLLDPKEPIAIKVFSMQVVYNICEKEPDLADELKLVLEDLLPNASAGIRSRATKVLKKLQKLKQ